jgi:hypothetical protein
MPLAINAKSALVAPPKIFLVKNSLPALPAIRVLFVEKKTIIHVPVQALSAINSSFTIVTFEVVVHLSFLVKHKGLVELRMFPA